MIVLILFCMRIFGYEKAFFEIDATSAHNRTKTTTRQFKCDQKDFLHRCDNGFSTTHLNQKDHQLSGEQSVRFVQSDQRRKSMSGKGILGCSQENIILLYGIIGVFEGGNSNKTKISRRK